MLRTSFRAGASALVLTAAVVFGGAAPAVASDPAPISAYGALPSTELVQLSPSGSKIAFVTVTGEQRTLVMLDMATRAQIGGVGIGNLKVRDLEWIGEEKVMITTSTTQSLPQLGIIEQELFSAQIYDPARNAIVDVFKGSRGILPALFHQPNVIHSSGEPLILARAYNYDTPDRLDLWRIEPENGRARLYEVMGFRVNDHVMDSAGQSVGRAEYDSTTQVWQLYLRQGSDFRKVWTTTAPIDTPYLAGLGAAGDSVVVAADRGDENFDDTTDLNFFDVDLATAQWTPLRFAFSPQSLIFHPQTGRLIGATRGDDATGRVYDFIDPSAAAVWDKIKQAFAGRSPELVNWSDDFRKVVVHTLGARDPGTYYMVDLTSGSAVKVGGAYDGVRPDQVGMVRPITYKAADGLDIHGYLTLPPGKSDAQGLPLVVLPHGGPATHDTNHFDWWAQALASRGYAVLQPNFRGSTGYGDAFMQAGYGEWGRKMQTDLSDGVRYLAAQGVIDPARVCIVGASYGGYAALAGPTIDRGVYRCAVSVSGLSDLRRFVDEAASDTARRENTTTRYWTRFMGADRLGDRSMDDISPAKLAAYADAPILLIHGRDDTVVPISQSRAMDVALRRAGKPVELIELQGEDHWMSRAATRERMLTETLRFLQQHNPAD